MECYKNQGKLHRRFAFQILLEILQFFSTQPSLVDISVPDGKFKTKLYLVDIIVPDGKFVRNKLS